MPALQTLSRSLSELSARVRRAAASWPAEHAAVADEVAAENVQRLQWLAMAVVVLSLVHVLVFWTVELDPHAHQLQVWQREIVRVHAGMAVLAAALGLWAWRLQHSPQAGAARRACGVTGFVATLAFAALVAVIDQRITSSITPLLIGCALAGVLLQQRPLLSGLIYAAVTLAFGLLMARTQPDPAVLLSNRVNGLTAALLGWVLAVISWRKSTTNVLLARALAQRQAELEQQQQVLQQLATRDSLTGLLNRGEMRRQCELELALARRHHLPVSLLLVDLDHFKRVNDAWGHPAGDAVLQEVAARLSAGVRGSDRVARLGGEEFMLLLPHTGPAAAGPLAEKIRQRLALPIELDDGLTVRLTASIGAVALADGQGAHFESLYARADQALYRSKAAGRNRVELDSAVCTGD